MILMSMSNIFPVTVQPPHSVPERHCNATLWHTIFTAPGDANTKYVQDYKPCWCYCGGIGKDRCALSPRLTAIVPDDDISLINPQLMHTTYFRFVVVKMIKTRDNLSVILDRLFSMNLTVNALEDNQNCE